MCGAALLAVLDNDDFRTLGKPVFCSLFVVHLRRENSLRKVVFFSRTHNNIRVLGNRSIIYRDFVFALPVIRSVVYIENYSRVILFGKLHSLETSLSRGTLSKCCTGYQKCLCACHVLFVHVVGTEHKVSYTVAVHQYTALRRRKNLRKSQTEFFTVFRSRDVRYVDTLVGKEFGNVISEPVVRHLAYKADFFA